MSVACLVLPVLLVVLHCPELSFGGPCDEFVHLPDATAPF
jgi:hypothetical protein